jgi:low affinity Fe/Cu permease
MRGFPRCAAAVVAGAAPLQSDQAAGHGSNRAATAPAFCAGSKESSRMRFQSQFYRFAKWASRAVGQPQAFLLALLVVVAWAASGKFFGFSDTWQLVINTGTTIVTFLMVFLIQNTQNREGEAMQIKLDEVIRAMKGAHLVLLDLEQLTDKELDQMRERYTQLAQKAREDLRHGRDDSGTPEVGKA